MPILSSEEIFKLADQLPRISNAAIEIISHVDNPDTSRQKIIELVKADPQIYAECLKQANSAALGYSRQFRTINDIVGILGFNLVKRVALFLSAKSMINDKDIWFESVFTAICSQYLAQKAGFDTHEADKVYMAGLFKNYGAFILKRFYPTIYIHALNAKDHRERMKIEMEKFGITHPEISALILTKYGLDPEISNIIQNQVEVYRTGAQVNSFIEISRILASIQELDLEKIHSTLDTDSIKELVKNSGIDIFTFTEASVERIERSTQELTRA